MELFKELKLVLQNFNIDGTLVSCQRYGEGHINETYLAVIEKDGVEKNYILQNF